MSKFIEKLAYYEDGLFVGYTVEANIDGLRMTQSGLSTDMLINSLKQQGIPEAEITEAIEECISYATKEGDL